MSKTIEVIGMIYKSPTYLEFMIHQMKKYCKSKTWDVTTRIIANDATQEILDLLHKSDMAYYPYRDDKPNDYYLNRVYRAWNFGGDSSISDAICFLNSDMALSKGWLDNLLKHHDGVNIPCSRLVESGKMPSGKHAISTNFGRSPKEFDEKKWQNTAKELEIDKIEKGGLYMPCVFDTHQFVQSGGYPWGNLYKDGFGTLNGFVRSGDNHFFNYMLGPTYGMKHITVFDSLIYHIQEGEKDE